MDQIINWLLLTIIFVFDPLAIALVVAANFAFAQLKTKGNKEPEVKIVEKIVEVPIEVPTKVENDIYNDPAIAEALKHARRARKQ
jgi:ABC-type sulfate transport system permease component